MVTYLLKAVVTQSVAARGRLTITFHDVYLMVCPPTPGRVSLVSKGRAALAKLD